MSSHVSLNQQFQECYLIYSFYFLINRFCQNYRAIQFIHLPMHHVFAEMCCSFQVFGFFIKASAVNRALEMHYRRDLWNLKLEYFQNFKNISFLLSSKNDISKQETCFMHTGSALY